MPMTIGYIALWLKKEFEKEHPYCRVTIQGNELMVIENLTAKKRFVLQFKG